MNLTNKQLLIKWNNMLQGDRTALKHIYLLYHADLYRYALKITTQADLAKDAVQDTFLDLWNYRQQLSDIKNPKFYLLRSLRNQCLKLIKKQNRFTQLENSELFQVTILPDEIQLTNNDSAIKKAIELAMIKLSPRQKEIIYLKFYNNLDYEELAEVLDINYQSVVNHIYKAMQKLRDSGVLQHFKY